MSVIIIGAGHAGLQVADSLRTEGYPGNITVIDEGNTLPYQRPPLSKDYLLPGKRAEPMPLRSESFFKDKKIVLLHACVVEIKRDLHQVKLADGRILPYGRLVLATGARSRELPWTDAQLRGLHVLRTLHDAEMLHAALPAARRVVRCCKPVGNGRGYSTCHGACSSLQHRHVASISDSCCCEFEADEPRTDNHHTPCGRQSSVQHLCVVQGSQHMQAT